MATTTWTGSSSTAWASAPNWSVSSIPAAADIVIIASSAKSLALTASTTIAGLTLNGTDSLTLSGAATVLTVTGTTTLSSTGGIAGFGKLLSKVSASASNNAVLTATGGTLEITGAIANSGSLALAIGAGATDRLLLDAADNALSATFLGSTGTLEVNTAGALTLTNALAIGSNTVKLDAAAATLTDAAGATLTTGTITGFGKVSAPVTATGAGTIAATGGTLEINGAIADSGAALTLSVGGRADSCSL